MDEETRNRCEDCVFYSPTDANSGMCNVNIAPVDGFADCEFCEDFE